MPGGVALSFPFPKSEEKLCAAGWRLCPGPGPLRFSSGLYTTPLAPTLSASAPVRALLCHPSRAVTGSMRTAEPVVGESGEGVANVGGKLSFTLLCLVGIGAVMGRNWDSASCEGF